MLNTRTAKTMSRNLCSIPPVDWAFTMISVPPLALELPLIRSCDQSGRTNPRDSRISWTCYFNDRFAGALFLFIVDTPLHIIWWDFSSCIFVGPWTDWSIFRHSELCHQGYDSGEWAVSRTNHLCRRRGYHHRQCHKQRRLGCYHSLVGSHMTSLHEVCV